jgi:hypothetical protein
VTQTPISLPGGAIDPELVLFVDDFDTTGSKQAVDEPEFTADVTDGAMNFSVLAPGISDEIHDDSAQAPGDFTYTLDVRSASGEGEILASIRETEDDASWRFAVNPASQTWRLDRESTFGNGYYVWVTPREYGARMPAALHTITIARQHDDLTFLLNGVDVVNPVNTPLPEVEGPVTFAFGAGIQPDSTSSDFAVAIDRVTLRGTA